jgi:signal transduction histidine kinase
MSEFPSTISEHRLMVFLVDDQAMIGEAVRRQLIGRPEINFHFCSDGTQAVRQAGEIKPTVILQDLIMPGVDGLDLVRQFRQNPATWNIPIIVLSATDDPAIKSRAFSAGANDYLVKLPDKAEMIARLHYHSRAYLNQIERDEAYRHLRESQRQLMDSNVALSRLSEELRQNNEALRAAERLARVGSWSWKVAGDHAVWSEMLHEMFLWDIARPAPRFEELRDIFTPESFVALREVAEICVQSGTSYSVELEAIRTDGEHFFINAKGQAARNPAGEIVSVFGTIHDITNQKKSGELARKSAVLEERARIAGDIHDSLSQSFAAIAMQSEIAEEQLSNRDTASSMASIAKARELARFGLAEARRSALTLRPDHALQDGLVSAVRHLSERTSVKDLFICSVTVKGVSRRLDSLVEHELFRIAQEALHNAVRHAHAKRITIEFLFHPNDINMAIMDDGIGISIQKTEGSEGLGLLTMRERAQKVGATFSISLQPERGTRIAITLPHHDPSLV